MRFDRAALFNIFNTPFNEHKGMKMTQNGLPSLQNSIDMVYTVVYTNYSKQVPIIHGGIVMTTAKLFENGRSQAVRLPKECRFEGSEVNVHKIGNIVFLISPEDEWAGLDAAIAMMGEDFMEDGRADDIVQEREEL
jgi:antitoxin VapB